MSGSLTTGSDRGARVLAASLEALGAAPCLEAIEGSCAEGVALAQQAAGSCLGGELLLRLARTGGHAEYLLAQLSRAART